MVDPPMWQDKAEWEERAQKLRKVEEEIKQLHNLIESAKTRGLRFLVIWDSWTDDEKKIFADGVVYVCRVVCGMACVVCVVC